MTRLPAHGEVLITDGLWRKSVVAIRALGKDGIRVTVTGDSRLTSGFYSRYCTRRLMTPPSGSHPEAFREAIVRELSLRRYDLIIPMEDSTIRALLPARGDIEKLTCLPLPSDTAVLTALDKGKTLALASRLGISCPRLYRSLEEVSDTDLPVVMKPVSGCGSQGLFYIETPAQLRRERQQSGGFVPNYLIQDRIPAAGEEVGANLLFDRNGRCVAGFTYRRLRDYPVKGGPSTLRESTHDKELLAKSIRLLIELGWYGVAMVEFKRDVRDGELKLMEINPRFWGSLALPIAAGMNFPVLLWQEASGRELKPVFDYEVGVRARWLIPGDILHFLSNPDRFRLQPGFFDFFDSKTTYDDFDRTDLSGNLAVVVCTALNALKPGMWKYVRR
jgi:predicted ATP-grasp superfamily ATP-dependent carboligase